MVKWNFKIMTNWKSCNFQEVIFDLFSITISKDLIAFTIFNIEIGWEKY